MGAFVKGWLKDPDYVFWLGAGGLRIGIGEREGFWFFREKIRV